MPCVSWFAKDGSTASVAMMPKAWLAKTLATARAGVVTMAAALTKGMMTSGPRFHQRVAHVRPAARTTAKVALVEEEEADKEVTRLLSLLAASGTMSRAAVAAMKDR